MKTLSILGILFLLSTHSFAETTSKYEQLEKLFSDGAKPNISMFAGIYSGRCYSVWEKNEARPAVLVNSAGSCSNDGPAFPGSPEELRTHFFGISGAPADHYDNMTDMIAKGLESTASAYCKNQSPLKEEENKWNSFFDFEANNRPDIKHEWKQSGSFLVLKAISLMSQPVLDAWGFDRDYKANQVSNYCYFFKK